MYRPTEGEILHSAGADAILASLTRRQREAVLLLADGYTRTEAARQLGVSPSAITQRMQRAVRRAEKPKQSLSRAALVREAR